MKNYYALLGIDTSATKADVKKNYRLLATKFHPDKNSDPDAPAKFIEITEAYNVLSDKKARARYDLIRWQELKKERQEKESAQEFRAFVPPSVSLRTRRNKAQQIRGKAYQQIHSGFTKTFKLAEESFRIVSRYIVRILGIVLFSVILHSVASGIPNSFEESFSSGILNSVIAFGFGYIIFKLAESIFVDYKKDIRSFSIFFKLTHLKAASISLIALILLLIVLGILLKTRF